MRITKLLRAWRDAKKSAWSAIAGWSVRIFLAALVAAMAVKVGLLEMLR